MINISSVNFICYLWVFFVTGKITGLGCDFQQKSVLQ